MKPYSEVGYRVFYLIRPLFRLLLRIRATGIENIPTEGACIIAANHRSYLDPPVINIISPRPVLFMAKKELFEVPVLGWFIRKAGAIPVNRDGRDVSTLKRALAVLKDGHCVGIFPEGRRALPGEFRKPQPGVGFLIEKAGVPVIPVLIEGTDKVFPVKKKLPKLFMYNIDVKVGKPINFYRISNYQHIAEKVMEEIINLKRGTNHG